MGSGLNSVVNANSVAKEALKSSTHHGNATFNKELGIYEHPQYATADAKRAIDHIYMRSIDAVTVNRVGIPADLYTYFPSARDPIYTDITLNDFAPVLNS